MKQLFAAISVIALLAAAPSWAQTTSTAPTTKAPAAHKGTSGKSAKAKPTASHSGSSTKSANAATNQKTQQLNQEELSKLSE